MDDMATKAEKGEQDLRDLKRDIADLVRTIQRLTGELDALKRKVGKTDIYTCRVGHARTLCPSNQRVIFVSFHRFPRRKTV